MKKYILLGSLLMTGLIGGYSLVFGGNIVFNSDIRFVAVLDSSVYLGDNSSDQTYVFFRSNTDISSAHIVSLCNTQSTFLTSYKDVYAFELDYAGDSSCTNGSFVLEFNDEKVANASGKVDLISRGDIYETYLDYSDATLQDLRASHAAIISKNALFKNYTGENLFANILYARGQNTYYRSLYMREILDQIIEGRSKKYISPVRGYGISEDANKIPNTGRPYRADYTDGVHRGWDVYAPFGSDAIALDDGIIVRIVDTFTDADFNRIVYGENLSEMQELKNLDILRGKQVWLKTMKGDVVFYSHLDSVASGLREGDIVSRGDLLGQTGVSGVPEEGYNDYHLHFSIMENPYNDEKAGSYDFGDYMMWDWLTKGMDHNHTVEAGTQIFE